MYIFPTLLFIYLQKCYVYPPCTGQDVWMHSKVEGPMEHPYSAIHKQQKSQSSFLCLKTRLICMEEAPVVGNFKLAWGIRALLPAVRLDHDGWPLMVTAQRQHCVCERRTCSNPSWADIFVLKGGGWLEGPWWGQLTSSQSRRNHSHRGKLSNSSG